MFIFIEFFSGIIVEEPFFVRKKYNKSFYKNYLS